jgi:sulfatase maturation enzyme AslB (radical SAM superfamily)
MNTFCVLPWVGREMSWHKTETHCCLLPNIYDIDEIKADMLAGKRPAACQKCWNLEDQGLQSDRQLKNSALDFYQDRDLQFIYKDAKDDKLNDILMLKLITSFTCNATCVSCVNFNASSSWNQLHHRSNPTIPIQPTTFVDLEKVKETVDFKELKMLSLIGGEPLYEKKNFDLLEHILDLGNNTVFLSLVTNGSVKLTARQKSILSKFKNVNFCISIDGTGPVFEYLRYPLEWSNLTSNLKFFREVTDNVSANYTLSNLNILNHTDTITWFAEQNILYSNNPVYTPTWLQPRALPVEIKELLKNRLTTQDYKAYIGDKHTEQDQQNFEQMLIEIKKQDSAKGITISNYLPELSKLINLV